MLAKVTSKNQITLPKAVVSLFRGVEYFEVRAEGEKIILEPVRRARTHEVWEKLEKLGITEMDVADALKWARKRPAPGPLKVVVDTNVLVSALLFRDGALAWLRRAWQAGSVLPLASPEAIDKLVRVLGYAKFALEGREIEEILALYLPFVVPVLADPKADASVPKCQDPDDQKFLDLAHRAKAVALVTGDRVVLELSGERGDFAPAVHGVLVRISGRLVIEGGDGRFSDLHEAWIQSLA
jgi:putative PIN family toxin of toxin-antitoxin system